MNTNRSKDIQWVMSVVRQYPELQQFFGPYFHGDEDDAHTIEELLQMYFQDIDLQYTDDLFNIIKEFDHLITQQYTEEELKAIIIKLGCHIDIEDHVFTEDDAKEINQRRARKEFYPLEKIEDRNNTIMPNIPYPSNWKPSANNYTQWIRDLRDRLQHEYDTRMSSLSVSQKNHEN